MSSLMPSIQHRGGVLASVIEQEKILTNMKPGKDAVKLSLSRR